MRQEDTERILRRRWVHSHEEDTDREMVFRPAAFKFPPSRGRRSFELKPDGALLEGRIGPTDRPLETQGTWELQDDRLVLRRGPLEAPRRMRIASVDDDQLIVEKYVRCVRCASSAKGQRMKVATYRLTPDTPGAPLDLPPEVFWVRFGDEREADLRSIQRSAWKVNSPKFTCTILHSLRSVGPSEPL